jgi:hypothetical protein
VVRWFGFKVGLDRLDVLPLDVPLLVIDRWLTIWDPVTAQLGWMLCVPRWCFIIGSVRLLVDLQLM